MITDSLPDNWGWGVESIAEGESSGSTDSDSTDEDPNAGTEFGQEGDNYYGQSELEDLYTPDTGQDPAIDDSGDSFQGEDSWMDFQKDEDGAGSRYERGDSTNWVEDAALQFDTETVDELTVPDLDFTDIQEEVFSERGQTVVPEDTSAEPTSTTSAPESTLPDGWLPTAPESSSDTSGGTLGVSPWVIAAAVVAAGAVAYGVSQS